MAAGIVHDNDVARMKRREKDLLHAEAEAFARRLALEKPGRLNAVMPQGHQERHGLPTAVWIAEGHLK